MSSAKYVVIAIFACAACAVVGKPNVLPFAIARHHTVCRTKAVFDRDDDRIPKIIKMVKCEDDPYEMCPASDASSVACCGGLPLGGATRFSCTEVQDDVLVKHSRTMEENYIKVAIGCSCIKQNPNTASE